MSTTLHLIPNGDYNSTTTYLRHLAATKPIHVAVLRGRGSALTTFLPSTHTTYLSSSDRWDVRTLWRLRNLVKSTRPDKVHVHGTLALRLLWLAVGRPKQMVCLSKPLQPTTTGYRLTLWDRWLLQHTDRIFVNSRAQFNECLRFDLPREKLTVVPPVAMSSCHVPESSVPASIRHDPPEISVACVGPFEAGKGHKEAIWAYDVLRYYMPETRLWMIGTGSALADLQCFTRSLQLESCVRFVGPVPDAVALMRRAAVIWVPSLMDRGHTVIVEAMSQGKPVIATDWPGLAEIVRGGESEFLVPSGDKYELCRRTRMVLEDAAFCEPMRQAD